MNKIILICLILIITFFQLPPHWAMLIGLVATLTLKLTHQELGHIKTAGAKSLQYSIILLGSSLNFYHVMNQGSQNIILTFASIAFVMITGFLLSTLFKIKNPLSTLISSGTAICGGSAIGAIGPALSADNLSMAISLGIVFLLNACSIFMLPSLGHFFELSQTQFGVWAALAIHDTSAVVAASSIYGDEALQIATTLKLTRALWIIPLALILTSVHQTKTKIKYPWFILYFVLVSLIFTLVASLHSFIPHLKIISKTGFSLSLFFIGLSLSRSQLKAIEMKTIIFGILLWGLTLVSSFIYIKNFT